MPPPVPPLSEFRRLSLLEMIRIGNLDRENYSDPDPYWVRIPGSGYLFGTRFRFRINEVQKENLITKFTRRRKMKFQFSGSPAVLLALYRYTTG